MILTTQPRDYIYFVGTTDGLLVKIGTSDRPMRRFGSLRGQSPVALEFLAFARAAEGDETHILRTLKKHRAHHEWFHRVGEVSSLISYVVEFCRLPDCMKANRPAVSRHYQPPNLLRLVTKDVAA